MSSDAPPALTFDGALHRHANGAGVGPIDLAVRPGQVHAIVGLNAAGGSVNAAGGAPLVVALFTTTSAGRTIRHWDDTFIVIGPCELAERFIDMA